MIKKLKCPKTLLNSIILPIVLIFIGCSTTSDSEIVENMPTESAINYAGKTAGSVIAIKAVVNNRYLSSENGGWMTTNRTSDGSWEKFTVVASPDNDGYFGLLANNGKYVCSQNGGNSALRADRASIGGDWEKFKFMTVNGYDVLYCKTGHYVCAENSGNSNTIANRQNAGAWEYFEIETISGGSTSGSGFDFGGVFDIETSDECGSGTGTDTKSYATLSNNTSATQDGLVFLENSNGNYILQSCDDDGTRTEWKQSSTFSLSNSRKMSYRAKFYDYPSAGVTIAQVHNRGGAGRPLLRVEVANGKIEFVVVSTYVKNSGSSYTITGPNYTEGSYLDLSIEVGSNTITVNVSTTSGSETATYTRNNSNNNYNINNNWYTSGVSNNGIALSSGFYFKAGVYNDSGNGSDNPKGEFTYFDYED